MALVRLLEGALTYETRALPQRSVQAAAPAWASIPAFVAQHVYLGENGHVHVSVVEPDSPDSIARLLASA